MTHRPKRRTILLATGAAAVAVGCGDSGGDDSGSTEQTAEIAETPGTGETGQKTGSPKAGEELATTDEIPVGGGKIFRDEKVVVTQPEEGQFKAFSAICTHQQCIVANVEGGTINCTCHGSRFSITDGAVENPPATRPLPAEKIAVDGNSIRMA
ncbi:Rieske (2Fe-2S) protein [Streptomyces sp. NPDC054829]